MVDHDVSDIAGKVLKLIKPLSSEERKRVIQAALVLLGETPVVAPPNSPSGEADAPPAGPSAEKFKFPKANSWVMQNSITRAELDNVFHIGEGAADIIGAIPGANKRVQTINVYILIGLAQLLVSGDPSFTDEAARAACQAAGCFDRSNHATILSSGRGSDITGSKEKGWTLTAPGLKRAAALVKEMTSS